MPPLTIALDVMGGDHGAASVLPAALDVLEQNSDVHFILCGDEKIIAPFFDKNPQYQSRITINHTDIVISADEKPSQALRTGKGSSMRYAINAVAEGRAQAVVSGGNTGALMAMSKIVLRPMEGIHRPAIASTLPTIKNGVVMLDLGANLDCDSEILVQFAVMGSVYARIVNGLDNPRVGILNVGSEDMKGHDDVRGASAVLQQIKIPGTYIGFVEGNDIPSGDVDVVVTDGFTGNVALKVAEGVGKFASHVMKDAFKSSLLSMMGAILAFGGLKRAKKRMDVRFYNGGMFLGLNGICVKSHGSMDKIGFANAIHVAINLARNNFNARLADEINKVMVQEKLLAEKESVLTKEAV
jgi:glycerol-3-phosphate acyltransferase PlsX